jgi:hypothetical protein
MCSNRPAFRHHENWPAYFYGYDFVVLKGVFYRRRHCHDRAALFSATSDGWITGCLYINPNIPHSRYRWWCDYGTGVYPWAVFVRAQVS